MDTDKDLKLFMDNNEKFLVPIFKWIEKAQKEQKDGDLDAFRYWVNIMIGEAQISILRTARAKRRT